MKDAIEEKLFQIIEKPEKKPDEDEMFYLSLAATQENPRPSKEGIYKVAVAANIVQLHVWLSCQFAAQGR